MQEEQVSSDRHRHAFVRGQEEPQDETPGIIASRGIVNGGPDGRTNATDRGYKVDSPAAELGRYQRISNISESQTKKIYGQGVVQLSFRDADVLDSVRPRGDRACDDHAAEEGEAHDAEDREQFLGVRPVQWIVGIRRGMRHQDNVLAVSMAIG